MTTEQLKTVHQARPYRPFTIHTADGDSHHVPHPELLAYKPGTRTCLVINTEDEGYAIIDLLLVTKLAVEPEPATK